MGVSPKTLVSTDCQSADQVGSTVDEGDGHWTAVVVAHHDRPPHPEVVERGGQGLGLGVDPQAREGDGPSAGTEAEQVGDDHAGAGRYQALSHTAPVVGPTREAMEQDVGGAGPVRTLDGEVHGVSLDRSLETLKYLGN